jgi:tetratricopeptide (TPR) repeat protein
MPPRFRCLVIQRELAPTNANVIDLDVMQRKDSLRLLSLQAGHEGRRRLEEEPEIAAALCEEMGDLPLALVQLGALIRIRPDLKPGQLLEDLRAKGAEARALQQAHMGLHVHGRVVETLMITWETLTEAAKELGVLLGVMAPAPIPWKLVEACRLPGQDVDEVSDFGDKQSELLRSGFLERLEQGIYQVHPFVWQYLQLQSQTQQELVIRWRKKLAMQAAKICREEIAQNLTLANIDALEQVLPHIRQVAEHYVGELRVEDLIHPFKGLAWISEQQAVYVDAIHWLRKGLAESENRLGPDHPVTAAALGNLAELLKATNSLAEAETLMRRALEIDESSYGKNHPFVAVRSNNLAALLQTTNRLAEADPLMQRALAIDEASYGPKHPKVAIRLTNLAALMQATNRLEEAEPLMRRALAIDESSYGSNHPAVARDLVNLAQLLRATKHLEEAESLIRRALAIDEASHGPSHPDVARDLTNLAQLLQVTMRLEEAELLMRRVLAIDEKNYSSNHPIVANTLNNLAQLLQITNSLEEAELLIQRALTIDVASYGTNHPVVARDLTYLAQLIQLTNRLEEAEALIRRALEIDEASYGPNHPAVASDLINLAQLMQATKRLEEAETLMRSALEIYRLTYDEHHPDINNVLAGLKTLQIKLAKQDSSTAQPPHVHDSTRQGLFICYSRKDRLFLEQFWIHFGPLEEVYDIWRWDDSRIQPGDIWLEEIEQALERTQVALLFVSPDLLASDFIRRKQLPKLFDAANKDGVKILWLPIRPCSWNRYPQIEQYQSVGSINPTLAEMSAVEMDREMVRITDRIHDLFEQIGKERLAAQEAAKAKPSALQQQEELVLAEQEAKRHADEAAQTERLSIEMARQDSGSAQPPHVHDSNREGLFICYSQKDRAFLDRFWSHLSPLAKDFGLQRWDDSRIQPGVIWLQEIEQALERAKVALLLVSPDFLAPGFILSKELPRLFEAARHGGLTILWLPIRPCLWQRHRQIEQYQAVGSLDPTLAEMSAVEMDREMVRITDRIHDLFEQIGKERLAAQEGAKAEAMAQRQEEERVLTEQEAKRQAEETARNEHLRAESEARAEAERWKAEAEAAKDEAERTRVKMEQLAREKGGLQRDLS